MGRPDGTSAPDPSVGPTRLGSTPVGLPGAAEAIAGGSDAERPGLAPLPGRHVADLLAVLRTRGAPVALGELAARIVASPRPLPAALARRVVASTLGCPPDFLSDPLAPELLGLPGQTPDTPLDRAVFSVVDLETTGLSSQRAEILEIGAVRVEGARIASRFETLVRPAGPVPPGITALTGITTGMVAGAPPPVEVLGRMRRWLDEAPGAPFVAHNARFDEGFVRRGLTDHGLGALDGPVLCTCKLARRLAPELGSFGLDRVAAGLRIRNAARHRALGDAQVAAEALIHLIARARSDWDARTVADLLWIQRRSPRALRSSAATLRR